MKLSEFLTELNNRIAAAKVSGFWTDAMKEQWIYEAVVRVCNFKKRWKFLELAKYTTTKANQEYYDEPEDFKTDSIYYMEVDGDEYVKKSWSEYQQYKAAESDEKIFAIHNGFYFLNPTPVEADKTIDLWGIKKPVPLADWKTAADDSVLPSEFDEAVIKLSLATALKKEKRYDEAAVEIAEVETPANPNVPGSGGILAKLADQEEGKVGYIGRARSSKFEM